MYISKRGVDWEGHRTSCEIESMAFVLPWLKVPVVPEQLSVMAPGPSNKSVLRTFAFCTASRLTSTATVIMSTAITHARIILMPVASVRTTDFKSIVARSVDNGHDIVNIVDAPKLKANRISARTVSAVLSSTVHNPYRRHCDCRFIARDSPIRRR